MKHVNLTVKLDFLPVLNISDFIININNTKELPQHLLRFLPSSDIIIRENNVNNSENDYLYESDLFNGVFTINTPIHRIKNFILDYIFSNSVRINRIKLESEVDIRIDIFSGNNYITNDESTLKDYNITNNSLIEYTIFFRPKGIGKNSVPESKEFEFEPNCKFPEKMECIYPDYSSVRYDIEEDVIKYDRKVIEYHRKKIEYYTCEIKDIVRINNYNECIVYYEHTIGNKMYYNKLISVNNIKINDYNDKIREEYKEIEKLEENKKLNRFDKTLTKKIIGNKLSDPQDKGNYFNKYIKYKKKYLHLKNSLK